MVYGAKKELDGIEWVCSMNQASLLGITNIPQSAIKFHAIRIPSGFASPASIVKFK
jgi:hypothetical protein